MSAHYIIKGPTKDKDAFSILFAFVLAVISIETIFMWLFAHSSSLNKRVQELKSAVSNETLSNFPA